MDKEEKQGLMWKIWSSIGIKILTVVVVPFLIVGSILALIGHFIKVTGLLIIGNYWSWREVVEAYKNFQTWD